MKVLHLHLNDTMGNMSTLIGRLVDGRVKYSLFGGTGSSGMAQSMRNIQFYDVVNGDIHWNRNKSLPTRLEGCSLEQFQNTVIDMLNNSTSKVAEVINK